MAIPTWWLGSAAQELGGGGGGVAPKRSPATKSTSAPSRRTRGKVSAQSMAKCG